MALSQVNIMEGYPSPDSHFVNERYLPAHSRTIFTDGLYKSDFSPFMGRSADRIDLSIQAGAPICQPADIQRSAGNTNVITYRMNRGMLAEATVNFRGQRLGLEEELHEDRAQVPIYTVEKYGSLGDWQGTMQAFNREFMEVKPHLLGAYQRAVDWLFYRTLLFNDSAALQVIESTGATSPADYFTSSIPKINRDHLESARYVAQVSGLTAPSVYSKSGGKVRRQRFPVLMMDIMVEDFSLDSDVQTIIENTAMGGSYDTAFERLATSFLTWDFYGTNQQVGVTGHMGHPLWPMFVCSAQNTADDLSETTGDKTVANWETDNVGSGGFGDGGTGADMIVGLDTTASTAKFYLDADLQTDWLRDWPQGSGAFWVTVETIASGGDWAADTPIKSLAKFIYTDHNAHTFKVVKISGAKTGSANNWIVTHPGESQTQPDWETGGVGVNDRLIRVPLGSIGASPHGQALVLSSYSIIYAPAPGNAPRFVYEEQDYQTRRGVGIQGALYFGPRMTYQRAYHGPIVLRFRMDYPWQIDGAKLYPKLIQADDKGRASRYGVKPFVGQSAESGYSGDMYDRQGPEGDLAGNYQDPTDFDPGNVDNTLT